MIRYERTTGEPVTGDVESNGVLIPYGNLAQWSDGDLAAFGLRRVIVEDPPPPTLTRTYKADIWRRATDAEAETIDAALSSQPVRLRRLWSDALWLETSDELYPTIQAAFEASFGAERAAQLLEPTE